MNFDWTVLKKSKDGIPTFDSLIPYILQIMKDGQEYSSKEIAKDVVDYLNVPKKIIEIKYPKYPNGQGILMNRFSFATSALLQANAIERPSRAVYRITDNGRLLLEKYGSNLTKKELEQQPAFVKYKQELAERNKKSGLLVEEESLTEEDPKQRVQDIVTKVNNEVATDLLSQIRLSDPYFFERLVVDLLVAMGYSGKNGKAQVTQKSNDGGIDGIINQDPLGTSTVYIQAKRYKEGNNIPRKEIQSFYGALASVNANKGVFITTSDFSSGAREFAKNQGIVLIDGIQLTDLMIEYQVGVETAKTYKIFKIDSDYFDFE